jgi:ParB family chromosome partitioning protein
MAKRPGLGKGLEALIPTGNPAFHVDASGTAREILIDQIIPNPHQPRTEMNPEELLELSNSIKEHGVIQPLILMPGSNSNQFILIAGERRLRAAKMAGLDKVPVILRNATEQEQLELALIENVQRADLSPLDTAEAYRQLADDFNLSHEEIANRVGKARVTITNTIRLLKLPEIIQSALAKGEISEGHARALLTLNSAQAQIAALATILKNSYSVRQTEELVRKYSGEKNNRPEKPEPLPEIKALEERFREKLGMRVKLDHHGNSGKITIHYYSNEELNTFIDRLLE